MRTSVREAFIRFTSPMEGVVPFLYLDVKGLVTIAIGNLVDPIEAATWLPLVRPDGSPATQAEIVAAWQAVKSRTDLAKRGGTAFKNVTTLRLTPSGIEMVVFSRLDLFDRQLSTRFPEYPEWPADAQLAALSQSWACGAYFRFPRLEAALRARDFDLASTECTIMEAGNPGVKPRNIANRMLWRNAAAVLRIGADPERLYWPAAFKGDSLEPETERNPVPEMRPPPLQARSVVDWEIVHKLPVLHDDEDEETS